jgi:hypothetical protein
MFFDELILIVNRSERLLISVPGNGRYRKRNKALIFVVMKQKKENLFLVCML